MIRMNSGFQVTPLCSKINIDSLITIHYFEYQKNFVFEGESHNFWEFLYVDKGEVIVDSNDEKLLLGQGEIIFHKPNDFHSVICDGNISPDLVVISFESNSESMDFFIKKRMRLDNKAKALLGIILDVAKTIFTYDLGTSYSKMLKLKEPYDDDSLSFIKTQLESFLSLLIFQDNNDSLNIDGRSNIYEKENKKRVDNVIAYLKENIYQTPSLEDVCDNCMISKSMLQKIFKEQTGLSIMSYFYRMKIHESRRMIRYGNRNFSQIAESLGYSSLQYFSRQFKKIEGMSPREYSKSIETYT